MTLKFHAPTGSLLLPADRLTEVLRVLPQVPDATYLVRDGRVFVFRALVRAVARRLQGNVDAIRPSVLEVLVDEAMPEAWMTPLEAVRDFGVHPRFLEPVILQLESEHVVLGLWHRGFDAVYPVAFRSIAGRNDAMARILLGGLENGPAPAEAGQRVSVISGAGRREVADLVVTGNFAITSGDASRHFVHGGQNFVALEAFQVADCALPGDVPSPGMGASLAPSFNSESTDDNLDAGDRPPALSVKQFEGLQSLFRAWALARQGVAEAISDLGKDFVAVNVATLAVLVQRRGLPPAFNGAAHNSELSTLYPELCVFPSRDLAYWWRGFEEARLGFATSAPPYRDFLFPFYVLGVGAGADPEDGSRCLEVGKYMTWCLLQGRDADAAYAAACDWRGASARLDAWIGRVRTAAAALRSLHHRPAGVGDTLAPAAAEEPSELLPPAFSAERALLRN